MNRTLQYDLEMIRDLYPTDHSGIISYWQPELTHEDLYRARRRLIKILLRHELNWAPLVAVPAKERLDELHNAVMIPYFLVLDRERNCGDDLRLILTTAARELRQYGTIHSERDGVELIRAVEPSRVVRLAEGGKAVIAFLQRMIDGESREYREVKLGGQPRSMTEGFIRNVEGETRASESGFCSHVAAVLH